MRSHQLVLVIYEVKYLMVVNLLFMANALSLFCIYREAVDFVLDELKAYEKGTDTYIIDGHFMPYSRFVFY
jgi:hypothetical protein